MQLEDEEFDLGQLLEDVVDLYHPLGMKKGIDVVLDPCDGSIIKFSRVRGDRGKLKQILCNLLSNAVKFTYEGHVNVRAWVKKPSLQDTIVASKKKGVLRHLHGLISKNKEERKDVEAINRLQENSNFMEFVFEVDDTGKGIPKEEQESVFENYVQVKETVLGQGGTGLGLGIVQSLVRLMGGDIKIVDKKIGEKGTCFRFNVIFIHCETVFSGQTGEEEQIDWEGEPKLTIRIPFNRQIISSPSPGLAVQSSNLKFDMSRAILLIQDDKRQDVTKKFMAALGVEVLAVKQWDQLPLPLHTVMEKGKRGNFLLSVYRKFSKRNSSGFVLLAIDDNAEPFQEIWKIISDFQREHHISRCRVFWFKKASSRDIHHRDYDLNRNDVITITKPVHAGRLYDAITLLSEFEGTTEDIESDNSTSSSGRKKLFNKTVPENFSSQRHGMLGKSKEKSKPSSENSRTNSFSSSQSGNYTQSSQTNIQGKQTQHHEIQEEWTSASSDKPLFRKRLLVAEDNALLGTIAMKYLSKLGATAELCQNGKEAVERYCENLANRTKQGSSNNLPYHYILMDCEMPIMNGYEAARQIREIEKPEGIHTPIIALSYTKEEGLRTAIEAGMDGYISKPLKEADLMEAIRSIHSSQK